MTGFYWIRSKRYPDSGWSIGCLDGVGFMNIIGEKDCPISEYEIGAKVIGHDELAPMELRDRFAMAALSLVFSKNMQGYEEGDMDIHEARDGVADDAYSLADAMLAARIK